MVSVRLVAALIVALASAFASPARADCMRPTVSVAAPTPRLITPADLVGLRDIGVPDFDLFTMPSPLALSPDGTQVAFILTQADPTTNSYCRQVVVAAVRAGAAPRTLDEGGDPILLKDDYRGLLVSVGFPVFVAPEWSRWPVDCVFTPRPRHNTALARRR